MCVCVCVYLGRKWSDAIGGNMVTKKKKSKIVE